MNSRHFHGPTQLEIAAHLDLSERSVRELLKEWGIEARQVSLDEVRVRYIRKLREVAAGRSYSGDDSLAAGRAKLAWEQAEKVARQNAIARGELAPVAVIQDVLSKAGTRAGRLLDTIPGEIRRREIGVSAETLEAVAAIVAQTRNTIAALTLADIGVEIPDEPDDQAGACGEDGAGNGP